MLFLLWPSSSAEMLLSLSLQVYTLVSSSLMQFKQSYLRVEVEPLERVDGAGELSDVVGVEAADAVQQGGRLHHRLEVGVVETHLGPEGHLPLQVGQVREVAVPLEHGGHVAVVEPPHRRGFKKSYIFKEFFG
jgi:hypothetical protein